MLWASTAAGSRLASSIEAEDRMCIVILLLLFLLFFLELKNAIWLSQTGFERLCCAVAIRQLKIDKVDHDVFPPLIIKLNRLLLQSTRIYNSSYI